MQELVYDARIDEASDAKDGHAAEKEEIIAVKGSASASCIGEYKTEEAVAERRPVARHACDEKPVVPTRQ